MNRLVLKVIAGFTLLVASAAAASAQVSDDRVKIGILNDQAGPGSEVSGKGSIIAATLAIEDFGKTVLGKPIELVAADHQNKPDIGMNIARKWFDADQVDMIADFSNSAVSLAVQSLAREKGKVLYHVGTASDRLYGQDCSPLGFMWLYDSYSIAQAVAKANIALGAKTWFILTTDYAFGHSMQAQLTSVIESSGGKVVGSARHPLYTSDFASFILQAQSSGAKVIALANTAADTMNSIKQASEFGLDKSGQNLVATTFYISNVHGLGLAAAKGLRAVEGFYWDRTPETRKFSERFMKLSGGSAPSQVHASVYSAVLDYLRAVEAAGTDEGAKVAEKVRNMPVNDMFAEGAKVRPDGRLENDLFLLEVKSPEQSKGPWDYYTVLKRMRAAEILRPVGEGGCKF